MVGRATAATGRRHAEVRSELAAERAATLSRLRVAVDAAVAHLEALRAGGEPDPDAIDEALDDIALAVWHLAVQRDVMGLPGSAHDWIAQQHDVPAAAMARVGARSRMRTRTRQTPTGMPGLAGRLVR